MHKATTYRSNGKLLLTAEYVVLDGAKALALPTTFGQNLTVKETTNNTISWQSINELGNTWFETVISVEELTNTLNIDIEKDVKQRLIQILKSAKTLNPEFLNSSTGYAIETHADFNTSWGLGTSSTLINNIAEWAVVNPYQLLKLTFGGSGYDIACASAKSAITYQIESNNPIANAVDFNPSFKNQLYFVYLNQKQNSRKGIAQYKAYKGDLSKTIDNVNGITDAFITCETLEEFQSLMRQHERLISNIIKLEPVKSKLFNDFNGAIKSLGAWGGDFVLVASDSDPTAYFKSKGYNTIVSYESMIL
ncbi:MAG: GHMP kinase [Winogradskyella sp.]|uniref:GYDIA family GHMP kinase n=1 Tax=Winogradskyella sp. TaxID=1883156 RepID=UPI0025FC9108|nr:GYDIA family GHMP kinase [Winogradskyella sp.]NRB60161.1 GHMP kinase [Winogradskyella sp.]